MPCNIWDIKNYLFIWNSVGYTYTKQWFIVYLKFKFHWASYIYFLFIFKNLFIYPFLAALGLRCCVWAFSSCSEWGLFFTAVRGPPIVVASPTVDHRFQVRGPQKLWHAGSAAAARTLQSAGSAVVVHRPSCSVACEILLDQGSNLCPLNWQVDSQPLRHQGSPWASYVLIC